ncbi:MAG: hypothetical protein Kow00105_17380 [Phycisphaeraceae bacterium]
MHELSIAHALIDLAREHVPPGAFVRRVCVRVGPLQAISDEAMHFAWSAVTESGPFHGAELDIQYLPWELRCLDCGRRWQGQGWSETCTCGGVDIQPTGSDELTLLSIDLEEQPAEESGRASETPAKREVAHG